MRNNKTNYTLVGAFVLVAFAALFSALYMLSGSQGPTHTYYTDLQNVSGITLGTPVTYAGYPVGQVASVTPEQTDDGTRYRIALALRNDWRIPDDSLARVVADGLLSAVSIDIEEGASENYVQPADTLQGVSGGNMFAAMSAVASEFEDLSRDSFRPLLGRLQRSVEVLSDALEASAPTMLQNMSQVSEHLGEQLPGSLRELHALSARLNQQVPSILDDLQVASKAVRLNTPRVTNALEQGAQRLDRVLSAENLGHVDNTLANLDGASAHVGQLVRRLKATAKTMNQAIARVDTLIQTSSPQVTAALAEVRATLRSASDSVDTIGYHLEGGSRNIQEFSRRVRDNPSALLLSEPPQEALKR